MKVVLIFTFCLMTAGADAVTTVTGSRGRSVQIKCSYDSGYEDYIKYLCRGECPSWPLTKDIPVQSGSPANNTRFSLRDDKTAKVFTVTITDLRPEDGGTYWCVIKQTGPNTYTEILVLVQTDVSAISTVSHTTHTTPTHVMSTSVHAEITHSTTANPLNDANHPNSAPSPQEFLTSTVIIAVSVVLLLLLTALLFAVALQRKKKPKASSPDHKSPQSSSDLQIVNCPVYDYEETEDSRRLSNTLYSTALPPSSSSEIYSNVGLPTIPSDPPQVLYTSVQLQSDSPDQDTYSTAQLPTILSGSSVSAAPPRL